MTKTKQELFDIIVTHLAKQRACAVDEEDQCLYLHPPTGNKCAIGCLIPDGHPAQHSRDNVLNLVKEHGDLLPLLGYISTWDEDTTLDHDDFLETMQDIHDHVAIEYWKREFINVAERFKLDNSVCDRLGN